MCSIESLSTVQSVAERQQQQAAAAACLRQVQTGASVRIIVHSWHALVNAAGMCNTKHNASSIMPQDQQPSWHRTQQQCGAQLQSGFRHRKSHACQAQFRAHRQNQEEEGLLTMAWCAQATTPQQTPEDLDCKGLNADRHSCHTQPQALWLFDMTSVCKFRHMAMHAQPPSSLHAVRPHKISETWKNKCCPQCQ
jgi:hypothetical protein